MAVWRGGWGPGWGLLFGGIWIVFWVAVVWLIVALVRGRRYEQGPSQYAPPPPQRPRALEVLEERYARGEISREEFLERRAVLLGTSPPDQAPSAPPAPPPTEPAPPAPPPPSPEP
jgi:putative membrane protein